MLRRMLSLEDALLECYLILKKIMIGTAERNASTRHFELYNVWHIDYWAIEDGMEFPNGVGYIFSQLLLLVKQKRLSLYGKDVTTLLKRRKKIPLSQIPGIISYENTWNKDHQILCEQGILKYRDIKVDRKELKKALEYLEKKDRGFLL